MRCLSIFISHDVLLFLIDTRKKYNAKIPSLGKFGPKNQNCQFKLKFGILTNSSKKDSLVTFMFSIVYRKDSFWAQIYSKKLNIVEAEIWNLD